MADLVVEPLGFPWKCPDPFLFCVHHVDAYPRANGKFGPAASLGGRQLGQDFAQKDGWNMYHGQAIPGFPPHPHRGFETITILRKGFVDHSDSLGAAARFGPGDVQWMTAGAGIVHSEMFPLLEEEADNPLELFQIWVNLPPEDKKAEPYFAMLWNETVPRRTVVDAEGKRTEILQVAGAFDGIVPPAPPPKSWASRPDAHVALWTMVLEPGARVEVPAVPAGVSRTLQVFRGGGVAIDGRAVPNRSTVLVRSTDAVAIVNGPEASEILLMQGRPIGRPVAAHGPFVMNTREEIQQAFDDYRRTRFGGWPWPSQEPVHARDAGRFARYPDGSTRRPPA